MINHEAKSTNIADIVCSTLTAISIKNQDEGVILTKIPLWKRKSIITTLTIIVEARVVIMFAIMWQRAARKNFGINTRQERRVIIIQVI